MNIYISDAAAKWFKEDFAMGENDKIKFFSKVYGSSPVQENFALGFMAEDAPNKIAVKTEVNGVEFFVEDDDVWFFDGHDLYVDYNEAEDELTFDYKK
ncbi:HesB/YadR/YfhF family protein [Bacillus sp. Marseille-P3800]|uniref:HesB/YadR/YfhF family protein n=1 Tax=Bacillus sp. Marseille-P3800 TaxID=2014782 RepID=UPI000C06E110|nr:HesB/YadR/YfhF family protein [Bacillus sp. Marseille-P3800]